MAFELVFVVPGNPIPQDRPRFTGKRTYTPAKCKAFQELVAWHAGIAMRAKNPEASLLTHVLAKSWAVDLTFYRGDNRRCDLDNLAKGVLDAMTKLGCCWGDDSAIAELHLRKYVDTSNPRTLVQAWVLG